VNAVKIERKAIPYLYFTAKDDPDETILEFVAAVTHDVVTNGKDFYFVKDFPNTKAGDTTTWAAVTGETVRSQPEQYTISDSF
jgi:hypothetical protein